MITFFSFIIIPHMLLFFKNFFYWVRCILDCDAQTRRAFHPHFCVHTCHVEAPTLFY